jgi:putative oxidoreductase
MYASLSSPIFASANRLLIRGGELVGHLLLLLVRLHWGWQFFLSGKGKLLNHDRVTEFFSGLGIPAPGFNAWFVGGVECIGGLLLLAGFFSRPVALVLAGNMLVAYLSVEDDRAALLGMFSDPAAFIEAEPFFYLFTAVLVLAFGAGALSVDRAVTAYFGKRSSSDRRHELQPFAVSRA